MAESEKFVVQITLAQRQLYASILSSVWNPAEADEVLHETPLVLWHKSGEFESSRSFLLWAMRFARFEAMAWLKRRQGQQTRLVFDDELVKLLADAAAADDRVFETRQRALASYLQGLRAEQWDLVARRDEPEASVQALSEADGNSPKGVSDRLRRIRQALLECRQRTFVTEAIA